MLHLKTIKHIGLAKTHVQVQNGDYRGKHSR